MPTVARMNNENELVTGLSNVSALAGENLTPPVYGEHLYDQIYSDIDLHYLMTPGPSVSATPRNISRSGSTGDLASMDGTLDNQVAVNTLRNQLSGLTTSHARAGRNGEQSDPNSVGHGSPGSSTDPSQSQCTGSDTSDYFNTNRRSSSQTSPDVPLSGPRPGSSNEPTPLVPSGAQTPIHLEYNNDELSKVPSYHTAVTSNIRTPWSTDLPSYATATSRPPSPQNRSPSNGQPADESASASNSAGEGSSVEARPGTSRRVRYTSDTRGCDN